MAILKPDLLPAQPTGDPQVIDMLRKLYDDATAHADHLASLGGHEREVAQEHLQRAQDADEAAMAAREQAERWRRHLAYEHGQADGPGEVESPTTVPIARRDPYGPTR